MNFYPYTKAHLCALLDNVGVFWYNVYRNSSIRFIKIAFAYIE